MILLPLEIQQQFTRLLNPRDYLRFHATCSYLHKRQQPYCFRVEQKHLCKFLQKAPSSVLKHLSLNLRHFENRPDLIFLGCGRGMFNLMTKILSQHWMHLDLYQLSSSYLKPYLPPFKREIRWSLLHMAAYNGHIEICRLLLDEGAPIEILDSLEHTPMDRAIEARQHLVCGLLIERGTTVSNDLLFLASQKGNRETCELLIQSGCDPNCRGSRKMTPFLVSSLSGNLQVLKCLESHGADIEAVDKLLFTALHHAAANGHLQVCEYLLDNLYLPALTIDGDTPFLRAAYHQQIPVCELLLKSGADVNDINDHGLTATFYAAQYGNKALIFLLLQYKPDVSLGNELPLHRAINGEHVEIVQLLLEYDPKCMDDTLLGDTALSIAAFNGNFKIVQLLIEHGANVTDRLEDGSTVLFHAAKSGSIEIAEYFVNFGLDVNWMDINGWTPLLMAACYQRYDMCQYLIDRGADPHLMSETDGDDLLVQLQALNWLIEQGFA